MSETVYQYFKIDVPPGQVRSCKNGGVGVICCRIDRPAKTNPNAEYKVAFTFCSPADQFTRQPNTKKDKVGKKYVEPGAHSRLAKRIQDNHFVTVNLRSKKPLYEVVFYGLRKLLRAQDELKNARANQKPIDETVAWQENAVPQWALSQLQRGADGTPRTLKMRSRYCR